LSAPPADAGIRYVDDQLRPRAPFASTLLEEAARLPSLQPLMPRLHAPNLLAGRLARAVQAEPDAAARRSLVRDLALARSFGDLRRAIIVDSGAARLWAVDGRRVAATMKVIVGKPGSETPQMAALLRYAKTQPVLGHSPGSCQPRHRTACCGSWSGFPYRAIL
jgi:hypothetical protein